MWESYKIDMMLVESELEDSSSHLLVKKIEKHSDHLKEFILKFCEEFTDPHVRLKLSVPETNPINTSVPYSGIENHEEYIDIVTNHLPGDYRSLPNDMKELDEQFTKFLSLKYKIFESIMREACKSTKLK